MREDFEGPGYDLLVEEEKETKQYTLVISRGEEGDPVSGFDTVEEATEYAWKHFPGTSYYIVKEY